MLDLRSFVCQRPLATRTRWAAAVLVVALAGVLAPRSALAAVVTVGREFQINSYTPGNQRNAQPAVDADGDFVIVWQSFHDGALFGAFGQRYSSSGAKLGSDFQVNVYTTGQQTYPRVATESDGDFVVVWTSNGQDGNNYGIFGRRFASSGAATGGEIQINAYTSNSQSGAAIAMETNGDFVVAWQSFGQDGNDRGIFARRFTSSGASIAAEFQVNTWFTSGQKDAAAAMDADGDFVVAWTSYQQDGEHYGVFGQRFTSAGTAAGSEFQISTYTTSAQAVPAVALQTDGDFVVAWLSFRSSEGGYETMVQRFASSGASVGVELQVNAYTTNHQGFPRVASAADGAFVVAWDSTNDGQGFSIDARAFDSEGLAISPEFQVNTYTPSNQYRPLLAINATGAFVVTWVSNDQDGNTTGVFGQRFRLPLVTAELDIDGNGVVDALTDGLLLLRHRFGFTGAPLINGAVGGNCQRCTADDIAAYITSNLGLFDVDGNAATEALADGLLVLRYLFGFRGLTLTAGATGTGCARCDAAAIEPYLAPLVI